MAFAEKFQVREGQSVRLDDIDSGSTAGIEGKREAKEALEADLEAIHDLQYSLYAEGKQSLLIVLQARDAGGKDGTIRALSRGLNPQGCHVVSFKKPSSRELSHDFLWRVHVHAPPNGAVALFNRSHYEDVLVVRVKDLAPEPVWRARYEHINAFERLLTDHRTRVLKFFLHISPDEQLRRFAKRINDPLKQWKISEADYTERTHWDAYTEAFEEVLERCSPESAPWFVIPADKKWYRNFVIARIIREAMEGMSIRVPEPAVDLDDIRRRYLLAFDEANHVDGDPLVPVR